MRGNPGRRRIKNEVEPDVGDISCPSWLDSTARKEWQRCAPILEDLGLLTSIDVQPLAAYCQTYADLLAARRQIQRRGRYLTGSRGSMITAPWTRAAKDASDRLVRYAAEFGCTPSSRRGLEVRPMKSTDDEVAKVLDYE